MNTRARVTALPALVVSSFMASLPLAPRVAARQPESSLEDLGLPVIDIVAQQNEFEGVPAELEAGRYLVNLTLGEGIEEGNATFYRPEPADLDAMLVFAGLAEPEGSPVAADPTSLPDFVYRTTMAGGVSRAENQPGQAVVDLTEGEWIVSDSDPAVMRAATRLTVTGTPPADPPEPEADIDIAFSEYTFDISGDLTAGDHLLRLENVGNELHYIEVHRGPDGMTDAHLMLMFEAMTQGAATPPDIPFDPMTDLHRVFYTGDYSPGMFGWLAVTLEAGTYAGFCWYPTPGGPPHTFLGMHTVFTVE